MTERTKQAKKFAEEAAKNDALRAEILKASQESVLTVARKFGFDLTVEDLNEAARDGELSEEELNAVAGGFCSIPMSALGEDKGIETDSTRLKSSPMRFR
jgi:predicted ribosomally synthesized peptide with nif11-like leader